MKTAMRLLTVLWLGAAGGCRQEARDREQGVFDMPATPADGAALMRSVDEQGAALDWPPGVLRHVRRGMAGRLLESGISREEIDDWIASPVASASQTNRVD